MYSISHAQMLQISKIVRLEIKYSLPALDLGQIQSKMGESRAQELRNCSNFSPKCDVEKLKFSLIMIIFLQMSLKLG
jgi:hypothetical protein